MNGRSFPAWPAAAAGRMRAGRGRRFRLCALAGAVGLAIAGAGCGSVVSQGRPRAALYPPLGLATTLGTPGGTWAVAVLGGSAAQENNFWQLFVRPAGSAGWRLVTPPGVASNGGLVLASLGGRSLVAGFRPSQDLVFSPLARTGDDGSAWSAGVLNAGLAGVPDALAAAPGGGRLLALLADGGIEQAASGGAGWSRLTSLRSLASAPAGRRCAPIAATAVSFTSAGTALAGVTCTRPGVAGIFSYVPGTAASDSPAARGGTWRAVGPALPAALAGADVRVLRLTSTAAGEVALLAAGQGRSAELLAGWTSDGTHWTVSAPLGLRASAVRAAGFAASGGAWVLLADGQADTIAAGATSWRPLPRPPAGTAALALSPAGMVDALVASGTRFTDWRLSLGSAAGHSGRAAWIRGQTLDVPVQYGSSS
jgi:hypothetical protein